jgi:hypothetical protein
MPYSGASDPSLPNNVQKLPENKKKQWVHVFNDSLSKGDAESEALTKANGVIKNKGLLWDWWDVDSRQFSMPDANYKPLGMTNEKGCAACNWFVPGDSCVCVMGDISPTGLCDLFINKPVYAPEPIPVTIVKENPNLFAQVKEHVKNFFTNFGEPPKNDSAASPNPPVQSGFKLFKSSDGSLRFFTVFTNNFKDKTGEIITEEAHKEYVNWATQTGLYPDLWLWHSGVKSKWGKADWVDYCDGFVAASGVIDSDKYELAETLSKEDLSVSHGFLALVDNAKGLIKQYRTFEISPLPGFAAANDYTSFTIGESCEMPFSDTKKAWLKEKAGLSDEVISDWESSLQALGTNLKSVGLEFKSIDDSDDHVKDLVGQVVTVSKAVTDLTGVITGMKEEISNLSKSMDDKVAEKFKAEIANLPQGFVPSQSDKNVEEKEKSTDKDYSWFMPAVLEGLTK